MVHLSVEDTGFWLFRLTDDWSRYSPQFNLQGTGALVIRGITKVDQSEYDGTASFRVSTTTLILGSVVLPYGISKRFESIATIGSGGRIAGYPVNSTRSKTAVKQLLILAFSSAPGHQQMVKMIL